MNVGIDDGAEFAYWQESLYELWGTWENVNETAVEYIKNPDVDKDNVTDGKEINGWKVKIIVGYDEENKPISKEVTLYGDPLEPYKDAEGNYIDSDEDNIPDIVESLLSNNTTFAKFARLFANPSSEYYDLWTSYNWTIAYFFSIRNKKSFHYYLKYLNAEKYSAEEIADYITEWNETAPHNKSCAENATQWLRDEFNPIIVESMSPVITQFIAVTDVGCFYAYTKVTVELRDPSGIGRIILKSQPEKDLPLIYDIRIFNGSGAKIWSIENLKLNITAASAAYHYYVICNATDLLENTAEWVKKVNGPIGAYVDTLAKLLKALWGVLCWIGKVLAKAFEILLNILVSTLTGVINWLLDFVSKGHRSWFYDIVNVIENINEESKKEDYNAVYWAFKLADATISPIKYIIIGIYATLMAVSVILTILSGGGITAAMSIIAPIVITAIVGATMQLAIPQFDLSKSLLSIINGYFRESTGADLNSQENRTYFNRLLTVVAGGFAAVMSIVVLYVNYKELAESSGNDVAMWRGFLLDVISTLLSWAAIILACMASYENLKQHKPMTANTYDNWTIVLSVLGIFLAIGALIYNPSKMSLLLLVLNIIICGIALAVTQGVIKL